MPTHDQIESFFHDYQKLTDAQKILFRQAIAHFVEDLRGGRFRKGLRVKRMQGHDGIWEMTWDNDGRATFEYGAPLPDKEGPHIIWRRIGSHSIFNQP